MAEQAPPGIIAGDTGPDGQASLTGDGSAHPTFHGRPTSWATCAIIVVGFTVGGIALCVGPAWWLFWIGAGIAVLGVLYGAATRVQDDWY